MLYQKFTGYIVLAVLPVLSVLLASVFVHSVASSVVWVYAELLLQFTVPNEFMGRVVVRCWGILLLCLHNNGCHRRWRWQRPLLRLQGARWLLGCGLTWLG